MKKCSIEAHGNNPPAATKVVYDSDNEPYLYLCPTCAEAFEEGQDVFDLVVDFLEDVTQLPQGENQ